MLTITSLKMWKDPGYTKGCLEIPPAGSVLLPAPDWQSSGPLRPRKHSTLTAIELPLPYTEVWEMSYLHMTAEDGSGQMEVYGWIDAVTITASSADAVRIDWTPDWWRTCSGRAVWGAGRIAACSDPSRRRPIGTQPRHRIASKVIDIRDNHYRDGSLGDPLGEVLWLIMSYRKSDSQRLLLTYPVRTDGTRIHIMVGHIPTGTKDQEGDAPSWIETVSGALPMLLGLQSTAIDGAWLSPICPLSDYEVDVTGDLILDHNYFQLQSGDRVGAAFQGFSGGGLSVPPYIQGDITLTGEMVTDDATVYAIADQYGNIAGSAPYGMPFDALHWVLDIGTVSASLKITLRHSGSDIHADTSEGMTVTLTLPTVPVSSSASSDYVYSGQREYEMQLRELQSERQAVSGISGVATGAIGGAIAGSVVPGAGTVAGALVGGIGSALGVGAQYLADTEIYNDKFQELEDRRYANQSGNLMIAGDGSGWILFSEWPRLIKMDADPVSAEELTQFVAQQGYPCDSPVADVGPFIRAGGPLRITNLTLTGEMPPAAKRSIKTLLAGGVRIIERNGGTS